MTPEMVALAVVTGMGIITYATRAGGVWAMGLVEITPRLERFLRHLAGAVVVSIVVGAGVRGDVPAKLALATSFVIMATTKRTFPALVGGIAMAAGSRALLGL